MYKKVKELLDSGEDFTTDEKDFAEFFYLFRKNNGQPVMASPIGQRLMYKYNAFIINIMCFDEIDGIYTEGGFSFFKCEFDAFYKKEYKITKIDNYSIFTFEHSPNNKQCLVFCRDKRICRVTNPNYAILVALAHKKDQEKYIEIADSAAKMLGVLF